MEMYNFLAQFLDTVNSINDHCLLLLLYYKQTIDQQEPGWSGKDLQLSVPVVTTL